MPPRERERMSRILLGSDRRKRPKHSKESSTSSLNVDSHHQSLESLPEDTQHSQDHHRKSSSSLSSSLSSYSSHSTSQKLRNSSVASSLHGGIDALYKALANISVQNAMATVDDDRIRIMGILDKSNVGTDQVNKEVARYLRRWVRRAIDVIVQEQVERMEQAVEEQLEAQKLSELQDAEQRERLAEQAMSKYRLTHSAFCTNVALLFRRNGEYNAASKSALSLFNYCYYFGRLFV